MCFIHGGQAENADRRGFLLRIELKIKYSCYFLENGESFSRGAIKTRPDIDLIWKGRRKSFYDSK